MIRHEIAKHPWPVFVRSAARAGLQCAHGHGVVVARRVMTQDGMTLSYDVRMADGTIRSCTLHELYNPDNIACRTIGPSPVGIPAPPARGVSA